MKAAVIHPSQRPDGAGEGEAVSRRAVTEWHMLHVQDASKAMSGNKCHVQLQPADATGLSPHWPSLCFFGLRSVMVTQQTEYAEK